MQQQPKIQYEIKLSKGGEGYGTLICKTVEQTERTVGLVQQVGYSTEVVTAPYDDRWDAYDEQRKKEAA